MSAPDVLPDDVELVRTTDVFDETNHPAGLLRAHRVAEGVWGRLVVYSGALTFTFDDTADGDDLAAPYTVAAGAAFVIPPLRPHHVGFDGPVTFAIEFYRRPDAVAFTTGPESSGLTD